LEKLEEERETGRNLKMKSLQVMSLIEAEIASLYQIVSIESQNLKRLDRLAVMGILPGGEIKIHQKRPSYVVRVGETDIAMDREVVKDIYVQRKTYSPQSPSPLES
jgi:Fe2+ transport system protein FeoA